MTEPTRLCHCLRLGCVLIALAGATAPGQSPDAPPPAATAPTEQTAGRPAVVPVEFRSPQATMFTFLEAMHDVRTQPQAWDLAEQCLDFSAFAGELDEQRRREICKALKRVIDRIEYVKPERLPDQDEVTQRDLASWTFFPRREQVRHGQIAAEVDLGDFRIELARTAGGRWVFSAETIATVARAYEKMADLPVVEGVDPYITADEPIEQFIEQNISPALVREEFLGTPYWKWLGLFVVILLGLGVDLVTRLVIAIIARRIIRRQDTEEPAETLSKTIRPYGLAAGAVVWLALVPLLALPPLPETIVLGAARIFAVLAIVWAAWRTTDLVAEVLIRRATRTRTTIDDVLIPMVRKAVKIFIVILGVIYGAESLQINILPLIASLGIGGVAFAFAAKDTVENFFGSVAVLVDRPFAVGDWIVISGDTEGIVEEIGFRSTRVRTFYNSLVTVPNANLVRAVVDNYGRRKYRRWKTTVGVQYNTPPDRIVEFCEGIRELVRTHPYTRKDYFQVYLNDFADSSLNILVYVFFEVPDWSTELRERERLFLDIVRLADQLGVSFAFPTQTVHLFTEEHGKGHQPDQPPASTAERRAKRTGIRAAHRLIAEQSWKDQRPGPVQFQAGPSEVDEDDDTQIEDRTAGG